MPPRFDSSLLRSATPPGVDDDRPLLSAALIVRNEAAVIADCLASLQGIADEIVVADTGSSDGTVAMARRYGARVLDFPWIDDFAAARNHVLDHARGAWILYIDADERLRPTTRPYLEALLCDPATVSYLVKFFPITGHTGIWEQRLFRNDPRIRFEGAIHEKIPPALRRVAEADGLTVGRADGLTLDHVGYDGDQRAKHLRNLPLLRRQLARDPDDVFNWNHLGRVNAALGDTAGAEAAWRRAIEIVSRRRPLPTAGALAYAEFITWQGERRGEVDGLLQEARRLYPDNFMLIWVEARLHMAQQRFEPAVALLERLAAIDGDSYFDGVAAYDKRIFGVLAYDSLGTACFRLARYAESARWYAEAARVDPAAPQHALRRRLAEAKAAAVTAGSRR